MVVGGAPVVDLWSYAQTPLLVSLLAGGSARTILAGGVAFGWGHHCMLAAPYLTSPLV
jgi:hypothetical protein